MAKEITTIRLQTGEPNLCESQINKVYVYKESLLRIINNRHCSSQYQKETRGNHAEPIPETPPLFLHADGRGWLASGFFRVVDQFCGSDPLSCACCAKDFLHSRIETVKGNTKGKQ
jgi:hypothetical protein